MASALNGMRSLQSEVRRASCNQQASAPAPLPRVARAARAARHGISRVPDTRTAASRRRPEVDQ
jgi:hypothetical protein